MTIEIRPARPDEYQRTGEVTAHAYREYAVPGDADWDGYLAELADVADRAQRTTVLVAVEDGRVLGTATLELEGRVEAGQQNREGDPLPPGHAHVRMVGVIPEARGRGVGRRLMEACIELARNAGKEVMTLNTTVRMKTAQAMYESMGFERGEDWVFDTGFVLLTYSLPLGGRAQGGSLDEVNRDE